MNEEDILNQLESSLVNMDMDGAMKACKDILAFNIPINKAINEAMVNGMNIVGEKYNTKEYFLADMVMAAEIMKESIKLFQPYLKGTEKEFAVSSIVIGTVQGDIHDIGKNLVVALLTGAHFNVMDLGTDVSAKKFVEAVRQYKPQIVGMSCLLSITKPYMETVMTELEKAGLRKNVKVIIGGAPITPDYGKQIGADATAKDAFEGVNICKKLALSGV